MQVLTATSESWEDLSSWKKSCQSPPASALSPRSIQRPPASALSPSRGFPSWSRAFRHTVNITRQVFAHYNKNGYFIKIIQISNLLGGEERNWGNLSHSFSQCPNVQLFPTHPLGRASAGLHWRQERRWLLPTQSWLISLPHSNCGRPSLSQSHTIRKFSLPISNNPKILSSNLNHSQNSFPGALGSFTARGKSAERRHCQVRL